MGVPLGTDRCAGPRSEQPQMFGMATSHAQPDHLSNTRCSDPYRRRDAAAIACQEQLAAPR
jgi:hypothetical protein